jgi:hypothetical protein
MTNDEPDALDRVLDKALAEYSREEPLSGLEQRVLNRVRAEGSVRRVAFGRWVLACGIAAVAVIILTTVLWKRPLPPGPGPGLAAQAEPSRLAQPQPPAPSPQAGERGSPPDRPGGLSHLRAKSAHCWRW